jgi:hypothetical protein
MFDVHFFPPERFGNAWRDTVWSETMTATVFGRIRRNQQSLELQVLYLNARMDRVAVARLPQPLRLPEWQRPERIWQGALQGACPHKNKSIACCVLTISWKPRQRVCFSVRQSGLRVLHAESSLDCSGSEQSAQKPAARPLGFLIEGNWIEETKAVPIPKERSF